MSNWALPKINRVLRSRCRACVERYPTGAVDMALEGPAIARPADFAYCAQKDAICPQGAITRTFETVWGSEN
jgi:ferredoxin